MTAGETPVELTVAGATHTGRALDLRDRREPEAADSGALAASLSPETVGAAVRTDGEAVDGVTVACPSPGEVHAHVGVVDPDISLAVRTALAAAARSRGLSAPHDDDVASVQAELAALDVPGKDGDGTPSSRASRARRRLAGTDADVERLRERVATLRGRLQAARDAGRDAADVEADLAEATRALSEAETERAAAREALARAERRVREARDARERRRRLQDRVANLERAARAHLVAELRPSYEAALASLLGGSPADPFAVDPVEGALAIGRVADLRAPVVLDCDRFASVRAAADWLGAPVIRV